MPETFEACQTCPKAKRFENSRSVTSEQTREFMTSICSGHVRWHKKVVAPNHSSTTRKDFSLICDSNKSDNRKKRGEVWECFFSCDSRGLKFHRETIINLPSFNAPQVLSTKLPQSHNATFISAWSSCFATWNVLTIHTLHGWNQPSCASR